MAGRDGTPAACLPTRQMRPYLTPCAICQGGFRFAVIVFVCFHDACMFDGIIGHKTLLHVLERAVSHPAPAYLFFGPAGVGKRMVAERFAEGLLWGEGQRPEVKGQRCQRLEAHPDFIRIKREEGGREIVVKQARELLTRMHLTSARGGHKVTLIEQADRLNEEAANALLKAVEEPDAHAVYLFIAEQPERLPATLRSRLVSIAFAPVPTSIIAEWIGNQEAAEAARGCPGRALDWLHHQEERRAQRREAEELVATLVGAPLGVQCAALERLATRLEAHEDAESAWRQQLSEMMRACEHVLRDQPREGARLALGLAHAWQLAGSSLSPRLALEWAATRTYHQGRAFSFLRSRSL